MNDDNKDRGGGALGSSFPEIPIDEDDERFHQSFSIDDFNNRPSEVLEFFDKFGFVILRDAVDEQQNQELLDDIWTFLEETNDGFSRNDMRTWNEGLRRFGVPNSVNSIFRPTFLRMRQNPRIIQAFQTILRMERVIVGHDRFLFHRPAGNRPDWRGPKNVHLDLNPHEFESMVAGKGLRKRLSMLTYTTERNHRDFISENNDVHSSMGLCLQGLLNLQDLSAYDGDMTGGTIVIPGSHNPGMWPLLHDDFTAMVVGPQQYKFDKKLADQAIRVNLRAGSLMIWNQRLIHGSTPNLMTTPDRIRVAIPIRAFSKQILIEQPKRAKNRARAIRREIKENRFESELTALGRQVFGL